MTTKGFIADKEIDGACFSLRLLQVVPPPHYLFKAAEEACKLSF